MSALAHPAPNRLLGYSEVGSDLGDTQIAPTSDSDDVTLELRRELLRHGSILPAGGDPTLEMSTRPTADPATEPVIVRGYPSKSCPTTRGNGSFPEERSSIVDSVVKVGDSAAGAPLTEEFEVEAGAQW